MAELKEKNDDVTIFVYFGEAKDTVDSLKAKKMLEQGDKDWQAYRFRPRPPK